MILYLFYMRAWVKVWGVSEVALRAANIPFAILLAASVCWASCKLFRRANAWPLLCLSPFIWFYMNEARPYIAVMSFSTVAIVAVLAYLMGPANYRVAAPWCCLSALLLAWGCHILAAFIFPSLVFMLISAPRQELAVGQNVLKDWLPALAVHLPGFVALGAFYLWTSTYGVSLTSGEPGLGNLAFVLYEFFGFAGLGPPRSELREGLYLYPHRILPYWPWLVIGVAGMTLVGLLWFYARPNRIARNLAGSLLLGILIALVVSRIAHLRLLGRHLAMFVPMLLILLLLWESTSALARKASYLTVSLSALAIIWGISDARLVLLQKYEKESYRDASAESVMRAQLTGGDILWAADPYTAYYYGLLPESRESVKSEQNNLSEGVAWPVRRRAIDGVNWTVDQVTHYLGLQTRTTILVLSRPDVFDSHGAWRTLIETQKPTVIARPNGFWIYEWQPKAVPADIVDFHASNKSADF
jgi:hypothetical protein